MTHLTVTMNSIGNLVLTEHDNEMAAWRSKKDLTHDAIVVTVSAFNIKANASVNIGVHNDR